MRGKACKDFQRHGVILWNGKRQRRSFDYKQFSCILAFRTSAWLEAVKFLVRLLSPFIIGLCIAFIVNVLMRAGRTCIRLHGQKQAKVCAQAPALVPCAERADYSGNDCILLIMISTGNPAHCADHCKFHANIHCRGRRTGQFHGGSAGIALGDCVGHQLDKSGIRRHIVPAGTRCVHFQYDHRRYNFGFRGTVQFYLGFVFANIYLLMQKKKLAGLKRAVCVYQKETVDKFYP